MKIKTSELVGPALDWAVAQAKCMFGDTSVYASARVIAGRLHLLSSEGSVFNDPFSPSANWSQGGLIIEREKITTWDASGIGHDFAWGAHKTVCHNFRFDQRGDTALIAAMRCFVASRLGDEVEVPQELLS